MRGLNKKQINHYLGVQPIVEVSDKDVWRYLVSPTTKSMLGDVIEAGSLVTMVDTVEGEFPGDEVSNLNEHRINGGSTKHIRFPYLKSTFITESGKLIIKRDQTKFVVLGWYGKPGKSGPGQLIYKVAFRDRCFDGTQYANDCSLQDFPRHDPVLHKRLTDKLLSVELSTYGFLPGTRVREYFGDAEYESFIAKPFKFVGQPEVFLKHFEQAFKSSLAPGQIAAPIPDMAAFMGPRVDQVAIDCGYDVAEGSASHYHVYRWGQSFGWRVTDPEKAAALNELTQALARLKEKGVRLTRSQESWVCILQSLPRKYIPNELYLGGPAWEADALSEKYLKNLPTAWMFKPLTEKAKELLYE